jgi:dihydropteroate synthase
MQDLTLESRGKILDLSHPQVMGILNVTPDSFSDGGQFNSVELAVERAKVMIEEGATVLDIGGESTGPGSLDVQLEEELNRVVPVIQAIRSWNPKVWISVDTWKAEVARQAIGAGADMVNDVTAFRGDLDLVKVVADEKVPVVLMYSKDDSPRTTKEAVEYDDVVKVVSDFLQERVEWAMKHGVARSNVVVDPGMGAFVSTIAHYSFEILGRLQEFSSLNCPLLVGASRKSFLAKEGDNGPQDRVVASVDAAQLAAKNGAHILRVHDVAETFGVINS